MHSLPRVPLSCLLLVAAPAFVDAGPVVRVGKEVAPAQRVPLHQIDHSNWDHLLRRYVDAEGNVAYAAWKNSAGDHRLLEDYLGALSTADLATPADGAEYLAFWVNAYNAVTVFGILREYPTSSIRNHTARLFGYNIWNDLQLRVGGQAVSLQQIEHDVLRKQGDPRIHFAIVCASRSCPRLLNEAYTADRVEEQISRNAQAFFADPDNFQFDTHRKQMRLSPILKWFADDFGSSQAARLRAIAPFLPTRESYQAAVANTVSVSYLNYDWALNDQAMGR